MQLYTLVGRQGYITAKPALRFHNVRSGREKTLPVFEDRLVADENFSLRQIPLKIILLFRRGKL